MILRTIKCDLCAVTETEKEPNAGWPGWGELRGVVLDNSHCPALCPVHLQIAWLAVTSAPETIERGPINGMD